LTVKAEDNAFPYITGEEQGSDPAPPAAGKRLIYPKAGGWYDIDDTGAVVGPFGTGGGGGGGSAYPPGSPDAPPTSPNAKDDEFDGTSSVTWTSTPTAPTSWVINTTRASHAVLRSNGNGNNVVGKYQTVPGSYPYTITVKVTGHNSHGASNRVGIFLGPASPTGASANILLATEVAATSHYWQRVLQSSFTGSFTSSAIGLQIPVTSGGFRDFGAFYFRFKVNSATSVDSSLSRDGWNFVTFESAFNPGFTPGVMGVFTGETGTADLTAHFDFFRVT
jgi:hypothetical protein